MNIQDRQLEQERLEELKEYDISIHIFTVSSTMVGVCLTVIGILNVLGSVKKFNIYTDNMLSVNALLYLISCFVSYASIRTKKSTIKRNLEKIADTIFLISLTITCFACLYLIIELSPSLNYVLLHKISGIV